jgi:hypothetical protein
LNLAGSFEAALLDDASKFVLEEEVAPAYAVGGLFGVVGLRLDFFFGAVLTELHRAL